MGERDRAGKGLHAIPCRTWVKPIAEQERSNRRRSRSEPTSVGQGAVLRDANIRYGTREDAHCDSSPYSWFRGRPPTS